MAHLMQKSKAIKHNLGIRPLDSQVVCTGHDHYEILVCLVVEGTG
jgi:hypothetical protein